MSDNLKINQPEDPTKINVNQQWEIDFWTKTLGVSEMQLRNAVRVVGPLVKEVKKNLGK